MQNKTAYAFVIAVLPGIFAASGFATDSLYNGDIGSPRWFDTMRISDNNLAMLKALAGSNGQPVVPPDCVEISGVFTFSVGNPFLKGRLPNLRVVSSDDRVDNVPRSPFIYQKTGEPPNFYAVLKRDLTYEFTWLGGREERFAIWRVPADAAKQMRLVFSVDPGGACKITLFGANQRRPAK